MLNVDGVEVDVSYNIVHHTITLDSCNNGVYDGYCSLAFDRLHSYQQVISSVHL